MIFLKILKIFCRLSPEKIKKCLKRICPCLHILFFTESGQYKKWKALCGCLYALLLALGVYELILVELELPEYAAFATTIVLACMLGVGITVSIQIRCIALLALPSFSGHTGRSVLKVGNS